MRCLDAWLGPGSSDPKAHSSPSRSSPAFAAWPLSGGDDWRSGGWEAPTDNTCTWYVPRKTIAQHIFGRSATVILKLSLRRISQLDSRSRAQPREATPCCRGGRPLRRTRRLQRRRLRRRGASADQGWVAGGRQPVHARESLREGAIQSLRIRATLPTHESSGACITRASGRRAHGDRSGTGGCRRGEEPHALLLSRLAGCTTAPPGGWRSGGGVCVMTGSRTK